MKTYKGTLTADDGEELYLEATVGQDQPSPPPEDPVVTIAASPLEIGEGQSSTITLQLSKPAPGPVTVAIGVVGPESQYTLSLDSVEIPAGQTSRAVALTAKQDAEVEGNVSLVVRIDTAAGAAVGSPNSATLTITDDDAPPPPPPPPGEDETAPIVAMETADRVVRPTNSTVDVVAVVTDETQLAKVELLWTNSANGKTWAIDSGDSSNLFSCTVNGDRYTYHVNVGVVGERAWAIRATDAAGNVATSETRTVLVQDDAPSPPPPPPPPPPVGGDYFVAPNASSSGNGSQGNPWRLQDAFGKAPSGSTVVVLPGTYSGRYNVTTNGVKYLAYGAEIVQPAVNVPEAYGIWVRPGANKNHIEGFKISCASNQILNGGELRDDAIRDEGVGTVIAHCFGCNNTQFVTSFHLAGDSHYFGNIAFDNGLYHQGNVGDIDRPHGHSFYIQNSSDAGKTLEANVVLNSFGDAMRAYSQTDGRLKNVRFWRNVSILSGYGTSNYENRPTEQKPGILIQGDFGAQANQGNEVVGHCYFGFSGSQGTDGGCMFAQSPAKLLIKDSIFVGGDPTCKFAWGGPLVLTGNRFVNPHRGSRVLEIVDRAGPVSGDTFSGNEIYGGGQLRMGAGDGGPVSPSQFLSTYSGFSYNTNLPTGLWVQIHISPYRPDWRLVVIYNWSGAGQANVQLNLPSRSGGKQYAVRNVQNLHEIVARTNAGGVTIPLQPRVVAQPAGAPLVGPYKSTLPAFGCFQVGFEELPW